MSLSNLFQSFTNHVVKKEVLAFLLVCLCKSSISFLSTMGVVNNFFLCHSSLSDVEDSYLVLAKTHTS